MAFGLGRACVAATWAAVTLTGCVSKSYAGVSFAPGAADPEVQAIARRAGAGDKRSQLQLGIRYEEGRGLRRSIERAKRLYLAAARSSGGVRHVYVPGAKPGAQGRLVTVNEGHREEGLAEAKIKLLRLERSVHE
jgi:hypothetical protein